MTVGYLEGQHLSDRSAKAFHHFIEEQPQFAVKLVYDSFQGLRERLEAGELDVALSLDFDMREKGDIQVAFLETCRPYMVISRSYDICQKETLTFPDLAGIPFIIPEDSYLGAKMIVEESERNRLEPELRYAANLSTVMLWTEAGMGVAIVNELSSIIDNPRMRVLREIHLEYDTMTCCGWKTGNTNPALAPFLKMLKEA